MWPGEIVKVEVAETKVWLGLQGLRVLLGCVTLN